MPLTAAAMLLSHRQFTANATDFGKVYGIPGRNDSCKCNKNASHHSCKQGGLRPPVSFAQTLQNGVQAKQKSQHRQPRPSNLHDFGNKSH